MTSPVKRKPVNGAAKGAKFERDLADYFVSLGYTGARRMIRTGTVKHADEGDIDGVPFTVQAKTQAKPVTDSQIAQWLRETFAQQVTRDHAVGLLIVKRNGYSAIDKSWTYLTMAEAAWLIGARHDMESILRGRDFHARVSLGGLVPSLLRCYPPS